VCQTKTSGSDAKISVLVPSAVAADKSQSNVAAKEPVRAAVLNLNLSLKTDGIDKLDADAL
jgi:hypothetical protein